MPISDEKETQLRTEVINGITFIIEKGTVPREVLEHIANNIVAATKGGSKCVDGRYLRNEMEGRTARPGGDLGIAMTLVKLGLDAQRAFDLVNDFRKSRNENVCWHSDHHSHGAGCGCGHCNKAMMADHKQHYDLTDNAVTQIEQLWSLFQTNFGSELKKSDFTNLLGDHLESAVLLISGVEFTVAPYDQERGTQFFIYDAQRDQEQLNNFYYFLREKFVSEGNKVEIDGVIFDFIQFLAADEKMRNATLGLLPSAKNKPIYSVNADEVKKNKTVRISFVANTPDLTIAA